MRQASFRLLMVVQFLLLALFSGASDLNCPGTLPVQQTATAIPAGWDAVQIDRQELIDKVSFYLSHPSSGGALVPDKTQKTGSEERVIWTFTRKPGDDFWMACSYINTSVLLTRKLGSDVSECMVSYDLLPSGKRLRLKGVLCK